MAGLAVTTEPEVDAAAFVVVSVASGNCLSVDLVSLVIVLGVLGNVLVPAGDFPLIVIVVGVLDFNFSPTVASGVFKVVLFTNVSLLILVSFVVASRATAAVG